MIAKLLPPIFLLIACANLPAQKAKGWLEKGDREEAMRAAAAVGDDNMMRQSTGVVVPESFVAEIIRFMLSYSKERSDPSE